MNRRIVESGAVIKDWPLFTGSWAPCVRYEGEPLAKKLPCANDLRCDQAAAIAEAHMTQHNKKGQS
jgi:hypothetical protein